MTVEILTYTYTSRAEIERLWSEIAVELRLDDLKDPTQTMLEVVEEATDTVNLYASLFYDEEDLANSRWVRSITTWIGAYLLSLRRGNPANFKERFEFIMEQLKGLRNGEFIIPRLSTKADFQPSISNQQVDYRFRINKLRVQQSISVGETNARQHLGYDFPFEWL